ncbi:MAG: hypothetical protein ACRD2O_15980 [Terriglobia bacterium]
MGYRRPLAVTPAKAEVHHFGFPLSQEFGCGSAALRYSLQGWVNHVRYGDTWGLRHHLFSTHLLRPGRPK